ncbi:MAG TPA: hypothetical protein VGN57_13050 [Pirellulaceae bacterium]|nr:hypothetical protein [Pirellulaceae bacterium]
MAILLEAAPPDPPHRLAYSRWRRRHQAIAKASHYRRQDARTKEIRL